MKEKLRWYHYTTMIGLTLFTYGFIRMTNLMLSILGVMELFTFVAMIDGQLIALCFALGFIISIISLSEWNDFKCKNPGVTYEERN